MRNKVLWPEHAAAPWIAARARSLAHERPAHYVPALLGPGASVEAWLAKHAAPLTPAAHAIWTPLKGGGTVQQAGEVPQTH